jgi:hypothetical protein
MPASLITFPHLFMSDLILAENCSGELPIASTPALKSFSFTSALFNTRIVSWFRRSIIGAGVLAGANKA